MSARTRTIRFLRHWHARIGVLAALFFIFLASSGIALNHTDALRLHDRNVSAPWLMRWYGLKAENTTQGYLFEHGYFAWSGRQWAMDYHALASDAQEPLGAVEVQGIRYVATASTLYLYTADGKLVDKLQGSTLPSTPLRRIGSHDALVTLDTAQGIFASTDGLAWHTQLDAKNSWAHLQPLPPQAQRQIAVLFAPTLSLERVLLDLHSGRLFGSHGPLLMDMVACILLILAFSGIWIYWRTFRKR